MNRDLVPLLPQIQRVPSDFGFWTLKVQFRVQRRFLGSKANALVKVGLAVPDYYVTVRDLVATCEAHTSGSTSDVLVSATTACFT